MIFDMKFVVVVLFLCFYMVKAIRDDGNIWCTHRGCSLCAKGVCNTTCKGYSCGQCPNGECCNSGNCNSCYNNQCCTTLRCNNCINQCNNCTGRECSANCHQRCFSLKENAGKLQQFKEEMVEVPVHFNGLPQHAFVFKSDLTQVSNHTKYITAYINSTAYRAVLNHQNKAKLHRDLCSKKCNFCTDIKCYRSCYRNCQNNSTYVTTMGNYSKRTIVNVKNIFTGNHTRKSQHQKHPCCHIVHPEECVHRFSYSKNCYRRIHNECSPLCVSNFVHFLPAKSKDNYQCFHIREYPYVYCGHYLLKDCDSCYVCGGAYDPKKCYKEAGCRQSCRHTMPHNILHVKQHVNGR